MNEPCEWDVMDDDPDAAVCLWTIYNETGKPGDYVAVEWVSCDGVTLERSGHTMGGQLSYIQMFLTMKEYKQQGRAEEDDPALVETWV